MRHPCGYMIEEDEECGKPSVANQGGWYLCAEHHDLVMAEIKRFCDEEDRQSPVKYSVCNYLQAKIKKYDNA